jgi:uncharacterized protein
MIPDYETIVALHHKYAPTEAAFTLVFTHCEIVERIAASLLQAKPQQGIDDELVRAGCLLHDIGVYSLYKDGELDRSRYITHGVEGERILTSENIDERVCRMASHHTGVGINMSDIVSQGLPLPHVDFNAESLEEEIVMYADKFHSKTPRFNTVESYAKLVANFGDGKSDAFMRLVDRFGEPNLQPIAQAYGHPII